MDADHLLQIDGKKAEGVLFPEIRLAGEGQAVKILHSPYILRSDPRFVKPLAVEGHPVVHPFDHFPKPLRLKPPQILPIHRFPFRLKHPTILLFGTPPHSPIFPMIVYTGFIPSKGWRQRLQ